MVNVHRAYNNRHGGYNNINVDADYLWRKRRDVGHLVGYVALFLSCINTFWIWNPSNHFAYDPPGGGRSGDIRSQIRAVSKHNYGGGYGGDYENYGDKWEGYNGDGFYQYSEPEEIVDNYSSNSIFEVQEKLALDLTDTSQSIGPRFECIQAIRKQQQHVLKDVLEDKRNEWGTKILLVDPAYHGNVGDHMLTVGELEFIKGFGYEALQCDLIQGNKIYPDCDDFSEYKRQGAKMALWHAGGNWGDLWRVAQEVRINSFRDLLLQGFTVIGMPQSLHYEDKDLEKKDVQVMKDNIATGLGLSSPSELDTKSGAQQAQSRVIFTWREKESYQRAKKLYPFADNRLMSDISFQIGPFAPIRPTDTNNNNTDTDSYSYSSAAKLRDIMLLLRDDHESKVSHYRSEYSIQQVLSDNPQGKDITFQIADWPDRIDTFGLSNNPIHKEYLFTDSAIKLLSLGRVVVGDRLHAAVLAYLSGLTVVYVDQKTQKISKTLRVALESLDKCVDGKPSRWFRAETMKEALDMAIDLVNEEKKKQETY